MITVTSRKLWAKHVRCVTKVATGRQRQNLHISKILYRYQLQENRYYLIELSSYRNKPSLIQMFVGRCITLYGHPKTNVIQMLEEIQRNSRNVLIYSKQHYIVLSSHCQTCICIISHIHEGLFQHFRLLQDHQEITELFDYMFTRLLTIQSPQIFNYFLFKKYPSKM